MRPRSINTAFGSNGLVIPFWKPRLESLPGVPPLRRGRLADHVLVSEESNLVDRFRLGNRIQPRHSFEGKPSRPQASLAPHDESREDRAASPQYIDAAGSGFIFQTGPATAGRKRW